MSCVPVNRAVDGRNARRAAFLALLFSTYMFEYMVTLTFIDQRNIAISGSSWQLALHYIDTLLSAAGFASFALLRRIFKEEKTRVRLLVIPNMVYCVSMIALCFMGSVAAYSVTAMLTAFSLGVLGGMVYFCMSQALAQTSCMGKVMAAGASAAVLLQYLLQKHLDIVLGLPVVLVLGFSATLWLTVKRPWDWLGEDCLPYAKESPASKSELRQKQFILSLTVVALAVVGIFYDAQMIRLNVQTHYQEFDYYAWPRLFLIAGYALIGIIGDVKQQKYVPIATLCTAMFAVFNPILLGEMEGYQFNMCIHYACLGASVSYFNLMFWNIAPKTGCPELWASMGRVISGPVEAALSAMQVADLPLNAMVGIDILMFVLLVLALAVGNYLQIGRREEKERPDGRPVGPPELTQQQRLALYAAHCSLTPRETEVLEKLLTTEDGVQEIADSLYISRRMLQRYIASIYEKTGTGSRIGLFRRYTGFMTKE